MKVMIAAVVMLLAGCAIVRAQESWHPFASTPRHESRPARTERPVPRPECRVYRDSNVSMPYRISLTDRKVLVFDLECQMFAAYEYGIMARRGEQLLYGPISSGKRGHDTPVGVYRAQHYVETHISTQYPVSTQAGVPDGGAEMPFAVFFNQGIAIHGGDVSRPRQSHGCVRVSVRAAEFLWDHFYSINDTTMKFVVVSSMRDFDQIVAVR